MSGTALTTRRRASATACCSLISGAGGLSGATLRFGFVFLGMVGRVVLEDDGGDELLRELVEPLQAAFDIMDEDNRVFKAAGAIRSDLGAKEFAAQQRGQPANFNGSVKITAQQRAGAMTIPAN